MQVKKSLASFPDPILGFSILHVSCAYVEMVRELGDKAIVIAIT